MEQAYAEFYINYVEGNAMWIAIAIVILIAAAVGWKKQQDEKYFIQSVLNSVSSNNHKLDKLVEHFALAGYQVIHRTENQVQLLKKKTFSFVWAFLWLLIFGVGLIVYIIYYLSKRDDIKTFTLPGKPELMDAMRRTDFIKPKVKTKRKGKK